MLRPFIAALVVCLFTFAGPARAREPAKADPNKAAQAMLDRVLPEVHFEGVRFADTIDFLRDVTSANIFVNWRALEAARIDRNAPVTAKLKQVKFGKALQLLLDDVAGGKNKLGFTIDDNVITVSTAVDLSLNVVTRVYDVRGIIRPAADKPADEKRLKLLEKLIAASVAPKSWRDAGGTTGSMRELSGQLIITQTEENHASIAHLVIKLQNLLEIERGLPLSDAPKEFPLQRNPEN